MADDAAPPLDPPPADAPPSSRLPLAQRALAVGFLATATAMLGALWHIAVRRRRSPTAGYAWSAAVMALTTIFACILAFWRPAGD